MPGDGRADQGPSGKTLEVVAEFETDGVRASHPDQLHRGPVRADLQRDVEPYLQAGTGRRDVTLVGFPLRCGLKKRLVLEQMRGIPLHLVAHQGRQPAVTDREGRRHVAVQFEPLVLGSLAGTYFKRPIGLKCARLPVEPFQGAQKALQEVRAFDGPAEDETLPLRTERAVLPDVIPMRLEEVAVVVAGFLPRRRLIQIELLGVAQPVGHLEFEELARLLEEMDLSLLQTGKDKKNVIDFPFPLRQGGGFVSPARRRPDERFDRRVRMDRNVLTDIGELGPQFLGFNNLARRTLLDEQRTAVGDELVEVFPPARSRGEAFLLAR